MKSRSHKVLTYGKLQSKTIKWYKFHIDPGTIELKKVGMVSKKTVSKYLKMSVAFFIFVCSRN